ncbi:Stringent starvation protein A [Marinomonas aquimarina]|uniref:Stringent starvation protein A n=1 Tax=Marinomonas aquimarina TaxID=295068 RepID=A0A1A8TNQ2_9GAMM|nr:glutathione S-transferase family protein [Marinomonas aquimarina]SBS34871.1 Stringent starvation protein A [Marinomonas aquimarina]
MKLIIANKNYSSWSLRGWLALKAFDVPFEEVKLTLFSEHFYEALSLYSPVKKVPVLVNDGVVVWDSLAIAEYVNETFLDGKAWPSAAADRAMARSVVAEMHSGYSALRNEMPMNCRARRRIEASSQAQMDIKNILALWQTLRHKSQAKGDFLFGEFSLADAFFAPVVFRFVTYGVAMTGLAKAYHQTMLDHPAMQAWLEEALKETDIVAEDEAGEPV